VTVPTRRRALQRLALLLCTLAVALAGIEGAVRARQWLRYGTLGRIHEFVLDPESDLWTPPPGRVTETLSINSLGFRGPELGPAGESVRIAFLGASTTYCAEVSSNEATWPSLVCDALRERFPGTGFEYVNAGVAGYRLVHSRLGLERRVGPTRPDVIVIYHASNDLTYNSRAEARRQGVYRGHADAGSWLSDRSLAWYLVEKNLLLRRRSAAVREPGERLAIDLPTLTAPFRAELTALVAEAQERAPVVALVTFSQRTRPEQTPEERLAASYTSLYYMPYMTPDGLLDCFAAYNQVIRDVARERGALLLDCAGAIPSDGVHFHDSVHLTDAGCELLARCVAEGLASSSELTARVH